MAVIFTLTFFAVFLAGAAILTIPFSSRARVRQSLDNLSAYEFAAERPDPKEEGFADRALRPLLDKLSRSAARWTDAERLAKTRHKLTLAGLSGIDPERFVGIKLGLGGAALLLYLFVGLPWLIMTALPLWLGAPFVALVYWLPDIWLRNRSDHRQNQIGANLADSIDILTIAIEAGLTFNSALTKVVKNSDGPLSEEFGRMLGELQIGMSRREAWRNLSNRTNIPELQTFCSTLIQAETLGISIGTILRTEAGEIRTRRRQAAEEAAMKTPVKMVFPIILCILPALMVVIIGPGILRIMGTMF